MIDLRNTREEAICVAGLKSKQEQQSKLNDAEKDTSEEHHTCYGECRSCGSTGEKGLDQDDEDDRETKYRLDPK